MPAGFSTAALLLGISAMVDRALQVRLHYGDPGDGGLASPIAVADGYSHELVGRGGFTREGATGVRYSNAADVDFGAAAGGNWGDGTADQPVSWISLWYDADNVSGVAPDTWFGNFRLSSAQQVNDGDPFVIRRNTIDIVSMNA